MATPLPAPEQNPSGSEQNPPGPAPSSRRVLACVLCQQRKVKCDRRFPCANCTRHGATCVPATQPRRRRRRFPERELLDRVRHYEDLLRRNNVRFEPLHKDVKSPVESDDEQQTEAGIADSSSASTPSQTKSACGAKYRLYTPLRFLGMADSEQESLAGHEPRGTYTDNYLARSRETN